MKYISVTSSMIDRVGYDPKSGVLEVRFVKNGDSYVYEEVPPEVFEDLLASDSKGGFMQDCIIGCYPYYKIARRRQ